MKSIVLALIVGFTLACQDDPDQCKNDDPDDCCIHYTSSNTYACGTRISGIYQDDVTYCTDTGPVPNTCSEGNEENCKKLSADYCCLYSAGKLAGVEGESYDCAPIPTEEEMEAYIAFAEGLGGEDVKYYCAQSVFTSVSLLFVGVITYLGF